MASVRLTALACLVVVCRLGVDAADKPVTGDVLFQEVSPELRERIPPMLKEGLSDVLVERGVVYAQRADGPLKLDIYRAVKSGTSAEKALPAIIVIHGGSWKGGDRKQLGLYAASLARRGYKAYAIEYRLAPKHKWPAQWEDVRDAVFWLKKESKNQGIDAKRIGAIGYSAGGHLASMLAAIGHKSYHPEDRNISAKVICVAAGGAPCDFTSMPAESTLLEYWLGATRKESPLAYVEASPLQLVTSASSPIVFFNGTLDFLVRPHTARSLSEAMSKLGIDTAQHLVPGAGHVAAALDENALKIAWEFLDKYLKEKKPAETNAAENKVTQEKP